MNHTPLPWIQDEKIYITGPDGNTAIVRCLGMDETQQQANAACIVQCVNSHTALVEALTGCLVYLDARNLGDPATQCAERARAALALAQKEPS